MDTWKGTPNISGNCFLNPQNQNFQNCLYSKCQPELVHDQPPCYFDNLDFLCDTFENKSISIDISMLPHAKCSSHEDCASGFCYCVPSSEKNVGRCASSKQDIEIFFYLLNENVCSGDSELYCTLYNLANSGYYQKGQKNIQGYLGAFWTAYIEGDSDCFNKQYSNRYKDFDNGYWGKDDTYEQSFSQMYDVIDTEISKGESLLVVFITFLLFVV